MRPVWRAYGALLALTCVLCVTPTRSQQADGPLLPWQVSKADSGSLPWEGLHHSLGQLLRVQARNNTVFVMIWNDAFAGLALNSIVSLVRYGSASNYIVGVVGEHSVQHCLDLRLPCYDASGLVKATEDSAVRYSLDWFHLVWAKTLVADQVFKLGYDVAFADADTVFLKPAIRAYMTLLDEYEADGSFMYEQKNETLPDGTIKLKQFLNSGNFYMRNNQRTAAVMADWMQGYKHTRNKNGNQLWLNWMPSMKNPKYVVCHTREQCRAVKAAGLAAIKPHPNQFDGVGQSCTPPSIPDICDDRRLYVHAVCAVGHAAKRQAFVKLGLWLIDIQHWPTDVRVVEPTEGVLPCKEQEAWRHDY